MYWFPSNSHEQKANDYEKLANELRNKKRDIKNHLEMVKGSLTEYKKIRSGKGSTDDSKIPGKFFFEANEQTYDSLHGIKKMIDDKITDMATAITTADKQKNRYIKLANDDKEKARKKREKELKDAEEKLKDLFD